MSTFPRPKTGTGPQGGLESPTFAAFRDVPRTGVIYVTTEAGKRGYSPSSDEWCNLGQGMPEVDALPGAPPRITDLPVLPGDQEYGPVAGLWELREAIAGYYNDLFRRGMGRKYSAENVSVSGGGRFLRELRG